MAQKLAGIGKNPNLNALLMQYMQATHTDENWSFYFDKGNNEARYLKFIKVGAPKQVNIDSSLRGKMDALAAKRDWPNMTALMTQAREVIEDLVDKDVMPRFDASPAYKGYLARVAAEKKLRDQLAKVRKALSILGIQEGLVAALIPVLAEYAAAAPGTPAKTAALIKMNKAARLSMDLTKANNMIAGLKSSGLI